jgi:ABC-type branched-subunit amino acid transport system ATPase component
MSAMRADERSSSQGGQILDVRDVTLRFGGVTALQDVTFDVNDNELFAIIGPNGAGKTSIFNCLNGVYQPQEGTIRFEGADILGMRPSATAHLGIARTFQNLGLFVNLNVIDNLMLGRHHLMKSGGGAPSERRSRTANGSRRSSSSSSSRPTGTYLWGCCRTGSKSASSSVGPWPWIRSCSCSTSPSRG